MKEDHRFITHFREKVKITTNIKRRNNRMVMGLTIFGIVLTLFGFLGIRVFDIAIFKKQNLKISLQKESEVQVLLQIGSQRKSRNHKFHLSGSKLENLQHPS